MPATNFVWPRNDGPPIFQVYGTKRKLSTLAHDTSALEAVTKRQCIAEESMDEDDTVPVQSLDCQLPIISPHEQPIRSQDPTNRQQFPCVTDNPPEQRNHIYSYLKERVPQASGDNIAPDHICDGYVENNNNNNIAYPLPAHHTTPTSTQPTSQNDICMDLSEDGDGAARACGPAEVVTDAEYEARCSMEARSAMEGEGAPDTRQYSIAFCDSYCVGGDTSPTSRRVRCFCKPSWEGMTNMRPYVSDYY